MARVQTMVQLSSDLIELLDAAASAAGLSRSAVIREALEEYLAAGRAARLDAELVAGYEAIPQGATDEWGDLEAAGRRATARTLKRLDAEEESAGVPW